MKAQVTLALAAVLGLTTAATADVLWDQSNYTHDVPAIVDQEFPDFPTFSSYLVMDVVADTDWIIESVTVYFTNGQGGLWEGINQARLHTFNWVPGTLPLTTDNPAASPAVPVTVTQVPGDPAALQITASDLDLALAQGNYWIGLTPIASFTDYGQEFHLAAPIINDNCAWRNPGGAFGYGTEWIYAYNVLPEWEDLYEGSILIEGIPAPGVLALLGLAGLVSRRRR